MWLKFENRVIVTDPRAAIFRAERCRGACATETKKYHTKKWDVQFQNWNPLFLLYIISFIGSEYPRNMWFKFENRTSVTDPRAAMFRGERCRGARATAIRAWRNPGRRARGNRNVPWRGPWHAAGYASRGWRSSTSHRSVSVSPTMCTWWLHCFCSSF